MPRTTASLLSSHAATPAGASASSPESLRPPLGGGGCMHVHKSAASMVTMVARNAAPAAPPQISSVSSPSSVVAHDRDVAGQTTLPTNTNEANHASPNAHHHSQPLQHRPSCAPASSYMATEFVTAAGRPVCIVRRQSRNPDDKGDEDSLLSAAAQEGAYLATASCDHHRHDFGFNGGVGDVGDDLSDDTGVVQTRFCPPRWVWIDDATQQVVAKDALPSSPVPEEHHTNPSSRAPRPTRKRTTPDDMRQHQHTRNIAAHFSGFTDATGRMLFFTDTHKQQTHHRMRTEQGHAD